MKKVVVFGCQQIAVDFINFLLRQKNIKLSMIVTYELPLDATYGYESVITNFSKSGIEIESPKRITKNFYNLKYFIKLQIVYMKISITDFGHIKVRVEESSI